ncbi:uncharacterized protein LOC127103605 [Lathyrus oleraceus]|uniref:uncharacterized protein LOC127103605 n=1 Tax=Pisum sativum TaxID=3888 RepID=UPI0021D3B457|nr:uncharacterized protein LOC127103605 [Pisum sativum]
MPLSNTSIVALRQQMDDSNHELVNMLTNQMGTIFNPVIQESAETNRQVANQLTCLCNFLGASARQMAQVVRQTIPVQVEIQAVEDETFHEGQILRPQQNQGVKSGVAGRNQMVLVNRHQDADQIVYQCRQEYLAAENNLTTIVERIMAGNGMSATLQRPLYASPLAEFILQTEAPRGMKVPKYTKFGGESDESTIEHIARYLTESGDLAHNECLRFYEGHSKISLAELSSIKRRFAESIDDYLNIFRSLKARVRHLERLRLEKVRHRKAKKEKIAFVDFDATNPIYEADYASSTELEFDVAELKPGSAYECRLLLPAQGKNPVENNLKFPSKTYTFNVIKCKEIFDLDLVQKAIQEGMLKFVGRKMKIDTDPLHQEETLFVEPVEINMVEISEYDEADMLEETDESPDVDIAEFYPKADEDLVDFLYRCKNKGSQVCLCPRCGAVTDKVAAENFQKLQLGKSKGSGLNIARQNERIPRKAVENAQVRPRSFVPSTSAPRGTWIKPQGKLETP